MKYLVLLLSFILSTNYLYAENPQENVARIIIMHHLQLIGSASGVLVGTTDAFGYILTAQHIMEKNTDNRYYVLFQHDRIHSYIGLVGFANKKYDLGLIIISKPHNIKPRPVTWRTIKVNEKLWLSGWGHDVGRVIPTTRIKNSRSDRIATKIKPRLGDSGGAVIDKDGYLVGIISAYDENCGYMGELSLAKKWLKPMLAMKNTDEILDFIKKVTPDIKINTEIKK